MLNEIMLLLFFAIVTGCSLLYYRLTRLSPEESIVAAIASIISLLFLSGLIGNLFIGAVCIYFFSALGWFLLFGGNRFLSHFIQKSKYPWRFFSPGYAVFFMFFIYGMFAFKNVHLYTWDEYSVWGRMVRHMCLTDTFPIGSGYLGGGSTQPIGTSLFHYLMVRTTGFVEGNMYISNLMLVSAGFLLPVTKQGWKKWGRVFLFGIFMFACLYIFGKYPYRSMLVDNPTAAWAGGLAAWLFIKKGKRGTIILPVLMLFVLPIFKAKVGLMLSLMILFFWFIQYLISSEKGFGHHIKCTWNAFIKEKGWMYLGFIILPFIGLFLYKSIFFQLDFSKDFSETLGSTISQPTGRALITIKNTLKAFLREPVTTKLTMVQIVYTWICFSVLTVFSINTKLYRKQFTGMSVMVIIGAFVYLAALIFAYITQFSESDGTTAVAFERYMSIYVIMGIILLFSCLFEHEHIQNKAKNGIIAVLVLLCVSQLFNESFVSQATKYDLMNNKTYGRIMKVREIAEQINLITDQKDQIYMVAQDVNGREVMVARYMMDGRVRLGQKPNTYIHNIKAPGTADNPRLQIELTMDDFIKRIIDGNYDYIWVYRTDEYFNTFRSLFEGNDIEENALYEVQRKNGDIMFFMVEQYE